MIIKNVTGKRVDESVYDTIKEVTFKEAGSHINTVLITEEGTYATSFETSKREKGGTFAEVVLELPE